MNIPRIETKDEARSRNARTTRNALIVIAIVEAIVIFGVVVPAVLKNSPASDRPQDTKGVSHE